MRSGTYRLLLGGELGDAIERVVVTGHPTLSRPVTSSSPVATSRWSRCDGRRASAPTRAGSPATSTRCRSSTVPDDPTGSRRGRPPDRRARARQWTRSLPEPSGSRTAGRRGGRGGGHAQGTAHRRVVAAGRDLDLMADRSRSGERRLVIGNRGLAGIDGTMSTAIGAALGTGVVAGARVRGRPDVPARQQRPDDRAA